ncbi:MAG: hypothetical protein LQ338_008218 [Usnochroma carphineum]|nr:MAG: hypothetical protein LQ338_008218 [Usnochroma carphineum]
MSTSSILPTNPPTDPPPGTDRSLPPSAPIAPSSPSAKHSPPFRPLFLSLLIATPILAALPPRKLDFYTFMLGATFVVAAEELTFGSASRRFSPPRLQAQPFAADLQDADGRLSLAAQSDAARQSITSDAAHNDAKTRPLIRGKEETGVSGLARKLWYGSEREGWKERRIREEREALEDGRGYGGLIGDAVREAFGGAVEKEDVDKFNEDRTRQRNNEEKG